MINKELYLNNSSVRELLVTPSSSMDSYVGEKESYKIIIPQNTIVVNEAITIRVVAIIFDTNEKLYITNSVNSEVDVTINEITQPILLEDGVGEFVFESEMAGVFTISIGDIMSKVKVIASA